MAKSRNTGVSFGSYLGRYNRLQTIILISLLVTSLLSFVVSLRDSEQYAGSDLRNKVVGARYLLAGLDPYAIEWSPPSEWFIDPLRRYPGLSRTTVTPLVLMAYCPFAWLPYHTQRKLWAVIEWLAMILCILVLMRIVPGGMARFVFLVFALLFFVSGFFWRLHVEKGQFYIFLAAILSLAIYCDMKQKSLITGILLGLLTVLRPTFLIILPLLLFLRRWRTAGVMALAAVALFTVSLLGANMQVWTSYVKNEFIIQRVVADKDYSKANYGIGKQIPEKAEGIDFSKSLPTFGMPFSSLIAIYQFSKKSHELSPATIFQINKIAGICFVILSFCLAFLIRTYSFNQRFTWIFIMAVVLSIDYFTPVRWHYTDVMFLPVIALAAPLFISPFVSILFPTVITCAFLIGYKYTLTLFGLPIASLVRSFLFMAGLNLFIITCVFRKITRSLVSSEKRKVKSLTQ